MNEALKLASAAAVVYATSWAVMELERVALAWLDSLTPQAEAAEAPPPPKTIAGVVRSVAKEYRIDPLLVEAVIEQESNWKLDAMRYEPRLAQKFAEAGYRSDVITPLATSFGLMQVVFGLHRERCGVESPVDLLDAETNVRCGVSYLRACFDKSKNVRAALVCYNGGEAYAQKVIERLAQKLVG